ncbi:hypothetical protein NMD99_07500 [Wolbachia endosymbiont of Listronotus oregonensis]|uniref:hypothetical protein n=1 Tax=Wolbachia endosymbiont of Listronotus oregonensis TaxID=2969106 RepID=UPI002815BBA1|nr:hypothetical protein [Wolbachia endosymbiont of Listronotus oregonensis]WMT84405.1 hypothetical protein NMD99_07500 [Wolbachia endosymbiont of Listronotus oregonensis]
MFIAQREVSFQHLMLESRNFIKYKSYVKMHHLWKTRSQCLGTGMTRKEHWNDIIETAGMTS